ncbi:hypothetical protein NIES23_61830 (plasmid) [Trichormus variabilis NIES-23]|uniref:Uncharacterized protein n=1 Tax=Trichormus variabilis NIES-23 TaxID=1973479 RepID=A0A1Z4KWH0_ANAVA|nr:hypothetical protein NIES23_61830 [Trichormus variabilis NIES-23]
MNNEIQLGLCNPPEPLYLYVKNGEISGESYLWYHYNIEQDKTIPVHQKGLTGYLSELRVTAKEFKGKDNIKLDIVVAADEVYIIRTGIETNFAKTFLLAASQVYDFSKPLIIAATAGDENVVFCRLYDAATKIRIRREWNPNADWASLISDIQSRLSGTSSMVLEQPPHSQDIRVKYIRTLLDYPLDLVKEYLQFQDATSPSQLPVSKVDALVKNMCLAWAANYVENPNQAEALYQQVINTVANGDDELTAINQWMQQIQGGTTGTA